ncbi:unnamed protein product [Lactuca saligna]|uniref:Uncharacterized protein n=1 Tax=Lactuca saligna TaxID=75948 RepID=A0AA35VUU6_LACSI|nr:unnamed protein product [Lactuca saligna]
MSETFKPISELHYGSPGTTLQGGAIQILGQRKDQGYVQSILQVSKGYTISNYGCREPNSYKKWIDNPIYIAIGMASSITLLPDTNTIPRNWFKFISKGQIPDFVDQCPDFLGIFVKFRSRFKKNNEPFFLPILKNDSFKLSGTITDPTNFVDVTFTDNVMQKLTGTTSEMLIDEKDPDNIKKLPSAVNEIKGLVKKMALQMMKTSTNDNLCFIITDVKENTIKQNPTPFTPTPKTPPNTKTTNIHSSSSSGPHQHLSRRSLTYEREDNEESSAPPKCSCYLQ